MTYKYKDWGLYKTDVHLKDGAIQTLYFFSKRKPKIGEPCGKPENMVVENVQTGLPSLIKEQG